MTDHTYLKIMVSLGEDLERAASAEPYDPDEYNNIINAIESTNRVWYHSRQRRSLVISFAYIAAILFVLYLVYCILSEGFF